MTLKTPTIDAPGQLADAETVDMAEFCDRDRKEGVSEHMHVLFDPEQYGVALFRSVGPAGEGDWVRIDMDDARIKLVGERTPESFFLADVEAENVLTLLDRYRVERSDAHLTLEWWEQNNSQMIEEHGLDVESLFAEYRTESGRKNKVSSMNAYDTDSNMMAKF